MDDVPGLVAEFIPRFVRTIERRAPGSLLAAYLHGSAAMGGWNPARSDVDLLVVVRRDLTPDERGNIGAALSAMTVPGTGMEMSIVTAPVALDPMPPRFVLHVTTGDDTKVIDGRSHPGDPDLVLHFAVCRARGIAVAGPPATQVLPEVPRADLLRSLAAELRWASEKASAHYAVLNACRAAAYAETAQLLSKVEGARWAIASAFEVSAASEALAVQEGREAPGEQVSSGPAISAALAALERALEREG